MLDNIRRKKDNFIYSFIILATVVVMGFYGVGRMQSANSPEGAAAWVNGDPISRGEFSQELAYRVERYQGLLGGQYDEKLLAAFQIPQHTLNDLIQFKLLAQQAKKMSILIPDTELADHIRSLPYYQKNGKFDAELYAKVPNRGIEERRQRERLVVSRLETYFSDRVKLTPAALADAYQLHDTKVDVEYAKIDFADLAKDHVPTSAEADAFLKKAPEKDLQTYYDSHKSDFIDKAQVDLKQIRVAVPYQATEAQKTQAKDKITKLAAQVTPGNFSSLATSQSDDEYAKKGGNVGWVTRGTLEPPLESALNTLPEGKVSVPVETSFGYFLLLVAAKKDAVVHPLAQVKSKVALAVLKDQYATQFAKQKQKEWDDALAKGSSIEPELKKWKVELKKTGPFSIAQGSIPNLGNAEPLADAIFNLTRANPTAKALIPYQKSFYYLKLISLEPPKADELSKNEEVLEKSVGTQIQTELLTDWVNKLQKEATIKTEINFDSPRETEVD